MNQAIEWIKSHPTESLLSAGAIGGLVWLMTRSSGGSSAGNAASSYYGAQLQMAALNTQAATQQAQVQAQQNVAAYAAQVQNNQTAAELAAVAAQYNAGVQTAQIAANAQNQQTTTQGQVATTYINAASAAQQAQVNAESNALQNEFAYLQEANQNQLELQKTVLPYVTSFNGSQNRLAFLQSVLNQPNAAAATQASYAAVNNPAYNPLNTLLNQGSNIASTLATLFA